MNINFLMYSDEDSSLLFSINRVEISNFSRIARSSLKLSFWTGFPEVDLRQVYPASLLSVSDALVRKLKTWREDLHGGELPGGG